MEALRERGDVQRERDKLASAVEGLSHSSWSVNLLSNVFDYVFLVPGLLLRVSQASHCTPCEKMSKNARFCRTVVLS